MSGGNGEPPDRMISYSVYESNYFRAIHVYPENL